MKRAALACALALATCVADARADDKSECVAAYSDAQDLRIAGKLTASHERLAVCSRSVCPAFIAHDCVAWSAEVEANMPTVIFAAKDTSGRDLIDVRVSVDGREIKTSLDGQAVAIDPGAHAFAFAYDGREPITQFVAIRIDEKNRPIVVTFPSAAEPVSAPPVASTEPSAPRVAPPLAPAPRIATAPSSMSFEPPPRESHAMRTAGYIVGASGIVALLGGATVGIVAVATKGAQCGNDVCQQPNTISTLKTEATFTNATLVAGGALLAGGVTLVVLENKPNRASLWIAPHTTAWGLDVGGWF